MAINPAIKSLAVFGDLAFQPVHQYSDRRAHPKIDPAGQEGHQPHDQSTYDSDDEHASDPHRQPIAPPKIGAKRVLLASPHSRPLNRPAKLLTNP